MITLNHIRKVYGGSAKIEALKDINLNIEKGEIYGIIGASGAGKSTLIRCINLLEKPTSGEVIVDGIDMTKLSKTELEKAREQIGMIFQHFNLLSSRTVYENVAFPLELAGLSKKEIYDTVMPLLELVNLEDRKDQYPSQLSGGQKQRVGIARALATKPKVLLCDEATSALDPQTTESILELLKDINARLQITIVLITHEMKVIKEICDRVAVIEGGHIIEEGPVLSVFTKPQATLTKEFVNAIIGQDLPKDIKEHMTIYKEEEEDTRPMVLLTFTGNVTEPIVSKVVKDSDVTMSILFGTVDYIKDVAFGHLIVVLDGQKEAVKQALKSLSELPIESEVIGHVPTHH